MADKELKKNEFDWKQVGEKKTVSTKKGTYIISRMQNPKGSVQIAIKKASLDEDGLQKGEVRHFWMPAEDLPSLLKELQAFAK